MSDGDLLMVYRYKRNWIPLFWGGAWFLILLTALLLGMRHGRYADLCEVAALFVGFGALMVRMLIKWYADIVVDNSGVSRVYRGHLIQRIGWDSVNRMTVLTQMSVQTGKPTRAFCLRSKRPRPTGDAWLIYFQERTDDMERVIEELLRQLTLRAIPIVDLRRVAS